MRIRAVVLVMLVLFSGCAQIPGLGVDQRTEPTPESTPMPDPDDDAAGWVDGYWYNESVDVNPDNGLNNSELEVVVSRSMARVEHIRDLQFDERVPVNVISRQEYQQKQANRTTGDDLALLDNVQYEALFMIDEETDSVSVHKENRGSSVLGYYSPSDNEIVVVTGNETAVHIDELTLGHELVHALQDQQFNLSQYNRRTIDGSNADSGLVEGDAKYVEKKYEEHCKAEWDCVEDAPSEENQNSELANMGPYLIMYQPYSDGPSFVKSVHEQGGWDAVNALYDDPPASTSQVIHPDRYGDTEPVNVDVPDRSNDKWERHTVDGRPDYGVFGEAAIFAKFMYPAYDSEGQTQLVPFEEFFNRDENGDLDSFDPLDFDSQYSSGWAGDKMFVYTNDANETAYVWKTAWQTESDAANYVDGYKQLLEYRNAEPAEGHERTWVIPDDKPFSGAYHVEQRGDTVVVVHAPSVSELDAVHETQQATASASLAVAA